MLNNGIKILLTFVFMAQRDVIELVKKYVRLLNKEGLLISKSFLYGSYAHNSSTPESDIDILLVSEIFDTAGIEAKTKAWLIADKVDYRIEPYSVGLKSYIREESIMADIAEKTGIEIVV